ncbi:fatty acyl-CoA reductase wat-like isoform X2 [Pectinophora gossypiella]|uniref:fatty acyl-CoA reductase wat-like isoform X2 n=1 Tax=Pectinophora gossypiella TaxID=13191 RepID=UPI00214F06E5|nr:fatty acyl-CoA reductase wat-like isoform X2 [Pectinophora gossypiella]
MSTDIKKIYMLVRPKKGKSVQERLNDILSDPVFDTVRKQSPFSEKLVAVAGDINDVRLGITDQDWTLLAREVNFIFHGAATTRFDEPLAVAAITNVRGTREVLTLGRSCKNLRSLVHISTAFSHARISMKQKNVMEQFYEVPITAQELIDMAESGVTDDAATKLMQDWPNTYCFTKAVAEDAVRTMSDGLPVCIVRPSIVIGAYREPAPGWVDMSCAYGPAGVMLGVGLGLVHAVLADRSVKIDIVPVDAVNNAVLAAGCVTAGLPADTSDIRIYTVTSSRNPVTWGSCGDVHRTESRKISTPKAVWYCYAVDTSNKFLFWLLFWLLHYIPAYFVDAVCWLIGKERRFVKLYTKAYKLFTLTSFFTTNYWQFSDKNLKHLLDNLNETDKQIYNFDVTCIDWKELMLIWCMGLRKYIVKDGLADTDYAVKKQFWLSIANAIVLCLYAYMWYKLFTVIYSGVMFVGSLV